MKSIISALSFLFLVCVAGASDLTLWYTAPGTVNLTQGLLLGNGRLGCIVPGNITNESIVLNEDSLWSGNANVSGADTGNSTPFGAYQLFGSLLINLPGQTSYTGYRRLLDIGTGVATVDYTNSGVAYHREMFCSAPDQVMVVQLTASAAAAYTGSIQLSDGHSTHDDSVTGGLMFSGALANGELYEAQLQVTNSGGTLVSSGGVINFTNCNSLTLVVALGTDYVMDYSKNYHGNDPHTNVAGAGGRRRWPKVFPRWKRRTRMISNRCSIAFPSISALRRRRARTCRPTSASTPTPPTTTIRAWSG